MRLKQIQRDLGCLVTIVGISGQMVTMVQSVHGWVTRLGHIGPIGSVLSHSSVFFQKMKILKIEVKQFTPKLALFYNQRETKFKLTGFLVHPNTNKICKIFSIKPFQFEPNTTKKAFLGCQLSQLELFNQTSCQNCFHFARVAFYLGQGNIKLFPSEIFCIVSQTRHRPSS